MAKSLVLAVHLGHFSQPTTSCPLHCMGADVSLWTVDPRGVCTHLVYSALNCRLIPGSFGRITSVLLLHEPKWLMFYDSSNFIL